MAPPSTFEPSPLRPHSALELYLASALMFLISALAALLAISYVYCPAHIWWIQPLCEDTHFKYLFPVLIPVSVWAAFANWFGWEYFRYA